MNYYDILDIPKNATTDQIKQKYRKFRYLFDIKNYAISAL